MKENRELESGECVNIATDEQFDSETGKLEPLNSMWINGEIFDAEIHNKVIRPILQIIK